MKNLNNIGNAVGWLSLALIVSLLVACGGKDEDALCEKHWQVAKSGGVSATWQAGEGMKLTVPNATKLDEIDVFQTGTSTGAWLTRIYFKDFYQLPIGSVGENISFYMAIQNNAGQWQKKASVDISRGIVQLKFNNMVQSFIVPNNVGAIESGEVWLERKLNGAIFLQIFMNNSRIERSWQAEVDNNSGPMRIGVGLGVPAFASGKFTELGVTITEFKTSTGTSMIEDVMGCDSLLD